MKSTISQFLLPSTMVVLLGLSSCETSSGPRDSSGTVFGKEKEPTRFYLQTGSDGLAKMGEIALAAKTIGRYRKMNLTEQEILRRVAEEHYQFMVAFELEQLRPKYEKQKQEVQSNTQRQISALEKNLRSGRIVANQAVKSRSQLLESEKQAVAKINIDWHKEANELLQRKQGSEFAIAVAAEDKKQLVGLAKIIGDSVEVSNSLLEVNRPLLVLDARETIEHQGRLVSVMKGNAVDFKAAAAP